MMSNSDQLVFVGVSGGIDSAYSAYLLKKQGARVVGVFLKPWSPPFIECAWKEEYRDAMRVCANLGIPFRFIDLSKEYEREVLTPMIEEYRKGKTPNPDILCNSRIKFGHFFNYCLKENARIATGHYAQIKMINNEPHLFQGADKDKDQTYFLYDIDKKVLNHILFPIGALKKRDIRTKAKKLGIPVSEKPDSTGVCFIGDIKMKEFLKHYIESNKGEVVENGVVVGEHMGVPFYTIGQRHGFSIHKKKEGIHYIVVGKDIKENKLLVAQSKDVETKGVKEIKLRDVKFFYPLQDKNILARIRHRSNLYKVKFENNTVVFESSILVTPGQSIVFYDTKNECLGGGIV